MCISSCFSKKMVIFNADMRLQSARMKEMRELKCVYVCENVVFVCKCVSVCTSVCESVILACKCVCEIVCTRLCV